LGDGEEDNSKNRYGKVIAEPREILQSSSTNGKSFIMIRYERVNYVV